MIKDLINLSGGTTIHDRDTVSPAVGAVGISMMIPKLFLSNTETK